MILSRACLALLVALLPLLPSTTAAEVFRADYSVSIRSFPVGGASLAAEIADGRYSIAFKGGVRGLARLFSDASTAVDASGRSGVDRLEPQTYSHVWTEDNEIETVAMRFAKRGVAEISLDPPREHPERYAPLTPESIADALDPMSAFLWPTSEFGPALCDRTLPLIDGKRRFDITLAFSRVAKFSTRDRSYQVNAVVCSFRYQPVAGHRISGKSDAFIADSSEAEAWMAPVTGGLVAPVFVQFRTRAGRVVLRATSFRVD